MRLTKKSIDISNSSFRFGRERPERPKAPSPGQAKRHPGYRVLEQLRPVRAKALPLTDRVLKIGINHCYCCPMRISKARLMLLPFQGATALTRGTQGVASLALGYVLHWASSPLLLNPKLQLSNGNHYCNGELILPPLLNHNKISRAEGIPFGAAFLYLANPCQGDRKSLSLSSETSKSISL